MEGAGDSLLPILLSIEVQKIESNAKKNNNGEKTFLIKIQEIRDGFAKIGEENGIEPEKVKALSNVLLEDLIVRDWR